MITSALTDDQVWLLLHSPHIPSAVLAAAFGLTQQQLRSIRHALTRDGWCCRVTFLTCLQCGQSLTAQGSHKGRQRYHPECRAVALKTINARLGRERWERTAEDTRKARAERFHEYARANQAKTRKKASNWGMRWDKQDDEVVKARPTNDTEIALQLGRTLMAVYGRRRKLKVEQ